MQLEAPDGRTIDPVEEWKSIARARSGKVRRAGKSGAGIGFRISAPYLFIGAGVGAPHGFSGMLIAMALLATVLLTQELPRALLARALGRSSSVVLSALGGDTEVAGQPLRGTVGVAHAIIGSVANLLVAVGALVVSELGASAVAGLELRDLAIAHAAWGLAQALPVIPFRAGTALSRTAGPSLRLAAAAGCVLLLVAANALEIGWTTNPVLFGLLVLSTVASVNAVKDASLDRWDERFGAARLAADAEAQLSAGYLPRSTELVRKALAVVASPRLRVRLYKTLAWSAIGKGDPFLAHSALAQIPAQEIDAYLVAAYLGCCNRVDEAIELLQTARACGDRSVEMTKLHIDLLFRQGKSDAALEVARSEKASLSADDWSAIERAVNTP
jgi:hypothetical protein